MIPPVPPVTPVKKPTQQGQPQDAAARARKALQATRNANLLQKRAARDAQAHEKERQREQRTQQQNVNRAKKEDQQGQQIARQYKSTQNVHHEETVPKKKYKPLSKGQMNATFTGSKSVKSGTDTQATTHHPYEATRYVIPYQRGTDVTLPPGYNKDLESKDKKKQLPRDKQMKLQKTYFDEGGLVGPPGVQGGWGGGEVAMGGGRQAGDQPYTLISPEAKKKKSLKKLKEELSESGFVGVSGVSDAGMTNHTDSGSMNLDQDVPLTIVIPPERATSKKAKKVVKIAKEETLSELQYRGFDGKLHNLPLVKFRNAAGKLMKRPPAKSDSAHGGGSFGSPGEGGGSGGAGGGAGGGSGGAGGGGGAGGNGGA